MAYYSKEVCLMTSNDERHLIAIRCCTPSGKAVCMQIIIRMKTAGSYAPIPPGCLVQDGVHQEHSA